MSNSNDKPGTFSQVTNGLWTLRYPMRFMGMELGRCVSILRLVDGELALHSTGPFSAADIERIQSLGRVKLMLDATTMHDTFSRHARAAFPESPYFVPDGFSQQRAGANSRPLAELDANTDGALQAIRLEGLRFLAEYACFHPSSRTLILCDLLFNLVDAQGYTRWAMKRLLGVKRWPAIDRPMRLAIADKAAFEGSLRQIHKWDFDRIIVAHGSAIEKDGKAVLRETLQRAGLSV